MTITREEVIKFINLQMDAKTDASTKKHTWHYGRCELYELLDYIDGREWKDGVEKSNSNNDSVKSLKIKDKYNKIRNDWLNG